jgi:hypothetical protein
MNEQKKLAETAQPEEQRKASSEGQLTLEHATKLANLEDRLNKLEEKVLKTEVLADSLFQGHSILCCVLEGAGLMKNGEPVKASAWNPDKIGWVQTEGAKGPYERYPAKDQKAEGTEDYTTMLQDLKAHNGKMMKGPYFYWVFTDAATVGRKLRKEKKTKKAAIPDIEAVRAKFSSELTELLTFTAEEQFIVLKPREFLGSENFGKIAAIVRESKGEYISEGKNSRFKIPRSK